MRSRSSFSSYSYSDFDSELCFCISLIRREMSWIEHFCSRDKNSYMCEVDDEWIRDTFNLYGLDNECPHYKQALNRILDSDISSSDSSSGMRYLLSLL